MLFDKDIYISRRNKLKTRPTPTPTAKTAVSSTSTDYTGKDSSVSLMWTTTKNT